MSTLSPESYQLRKGPILGQEPQTSQQLLMLSSTSVIFYDPCQT